MIRKVIVTLMGHIDHGKTTLADAIRETAVTASEPGAITQAIGASIVPIETVKKIAGKLLERLKIEITLPGFLIIDTPGHAAFINLRKRGGSLADLAVLVVDINEGFKPQTKECLEILKANRTPFVVAANKIDLLPNWKSQNPGFLEEIKAQSPQVIEEFEKRIYNLVEQLFKFGFYSERFDRVEDFTKQIAIVPLSSRTKTGLGELLMVLTGLAQKFLEKELEIGISEHGKGTILEVKEEKGLGLTLDVILYEGKFKRGDFIVLGGLDKPICSRIRTLLEPMPLMEMRERKTKFKSVKEVFAATGVKIVAPGTEKALAGMPLRSCPEQDWEKIAQEIQEEFKDILIESDKEGLIIKADNLGSLEGLIYLLKEANIPVSSSSIGPVSKKDLIKAEAMRERNPFYGVILAFNVGLLPEAEEYLKGKAINLFCHNIIYRLMEDYQLFKEKLEREIEQEKLSSLVRPGKFILLKGYVFRQSHPAVLGVEVLAGQIKTNDWVMNKEGQVLTQIKSMEAEQEPINLLAEGKQAALALEKVTVGRQINEGEILYIDLPEEDFKKLKELKKYLTKSEIEVLKEVAEIKRRKNPTWGI